MSHFIIIKFKQMDSQDRQQNQLNESKFLSQQINLDEIPTEEEIIDRAQELNIDDLALAKESLLKQLDDHWKPYINRHQHIYYINLEEQKAYKDHPIDMQIKITYALKNKKRMPTFRQYKITEVSENPTLIHEQIKKYKLSHKLNIVYEESEEESIRKQTKLNEQQDYEIDYEDIDNQIAEQIQRYERQLKTSIQRQTLSYKKQKIIQYQSRQKQHNSIMKEMKKRRLQELSDQIQKDWINKNQFNFNKSLDNVREEFQVKRYKLQILYDQQQQLLSKMQKSSQVGIDVRRFHREKVMNTKKALFNKIQRDLHIQYRNKIATHLNQALEQFNNNCQQFTSSKINYKQALKQNFEAFCEKPSANTEMNYRDILDQNLETLGYSTKINMENKSKRKHRIFGLDLSKGIQKVQQKVLALNVNEAIWFNKQHTTREAQYYKYVNKPSLPLRLMKKIL